LTPGFRLKRSKLKNRTTVMPDNELNRLHAKTASAIEQDDISGRLIHCYLKRNGDAQPWSSGSMLRRKLGRVRGFSFPTKPADVSQVIACIKAHLGKNVPRD
jgi:hypothetical protein